MNSKRYPVQNYVPIKPKMTPNMIYNNDLDSSLKQMTYNEIINDPDYHFENSYITNFDLIHNECRGHELSFSKKHYETISYRRLNDKVTNKNEKDRFISSGLKSERKGVHFEKKIFKEHFNREKIDENLQKKDAFLSSMKKKAFLKKKTDDCKSLSF